VEPHLAEHVELGEGRDEAQKGPGDAVVEDRLHHGLELQHEGGVLAEGCPRIDVDHPQARFGFAHLLVDGDWHLTGAEQGTVGVFGVDLAQQRALAVADKAMGQGARHHRLAHASLAGHKVQLAAKQLACSVCVGGRHERALAAALRRCHTLRLSSSRRSAGREGL
jgi:hypothetical protein